MKVSPVGAAAKEWQVSPVGAACKEWQIRESQSGRSCIKSINGISDLRPPADPPSPLCQISPVGVDLRAMAALGFALVSKSHRPLCHERGFLHPPYVDSVRPNLT